jgi:ribosomal protein S18 acetylase RimI-like enzyme
MLTLENVQAEDRNDFRRMAECFWKEIMPHSDVVNDPTRGDSYFVEQFSWQEGDDHPYWAVSKDMRVGFVSFEVEIEKRFAQLGNLYVSPNFRRKGFGTEIVRLVFGHLDDLGIEQIDLNVRRDNPHALNFWKAQGFGVALYRLRMYRDPADTTAYVGALSSDLVDGDVSEK